MPDTPRLVTKREAAQLLGVSLRTIERRIKAGDLPTGPPLHTRHGAVTRVYVDAPVSGLVAPGQTPDTGLARAGDEVALLALRALDEAMRENAALRARLQELQAQSHARDTAARPGASQRAWWRFWRRGGE